MSLSTNRLIGVGCGVATGALWGMVFLAPKFAPDASPMLLSAGRYLAYGVLAAALLAPRWNKVAPLLDAKAWRGLAWLSLAGNIVYYLFLVVSVHFAGVAASALIVGMVPVAVAVWGLKDPDAPPLRKVGPPILLAAVAVVLIGWESLSREALNRDVSQVLIGLACGLAALLSWSAYAIGNSRWMARLPQVSAQDWSLLTGVVTGGFALLLAIPAVVEANGQTTDQWARLAAASMGVAIFASIVGNAFWNQASRLLPLSMLGQMIVFETLFAFAYGYLWESRWPTVIEIVAMAMMVVSVLWCVRAHRPAAVAAAEGDH
ncbi:DMT family transporter [Brevundimonas kwangchunensis]|uniref:DMT family transporter n=1 Tax=Brevundimonas kwangchunensis TaxID=322163 RepID=A0ABP3S7E9_9CAUL